jgi:hypothetical protein
MEDRGSILGREIFSSPQRQDRLGPTQSRTNGGRGALSPRGKQPEFRANHSPPTSAKVKNAWRYTPHTSSWNGA